MLGVTKYMLWRGGRITNHLSRLKHFRGHGVHSPFVYSIVRDVIMKKATTPNNIELIHKIIEFGADQKTALEITALANHCNFQRISFNNVNCNNSDLIICDNRCTDQTIVSLSKEASENGIAFVILSPYRRRKICNYLLQGSCSTSIDRFKYMILLNNYLPKQHFKL